MGQPLRNNKIGHDQTWVLTESGNHYYGTRLKWQKFNFDPFTTLSTYFGAYTLAGKNHPFISLDGPSNLSFENRLIDRFDYKTILAIVSTTN